MRIEAVCSLKKLILIWVKLIDEHVTNEYNIFRKNLLYLLFFTFFKLIWTLCRVWAKIPDSDEATVDKAVKAAKKAFNGWKNLSVGKRADYLNKAADVLEKDLDKFAVAESRDQVSKY